MCAVCAARLADATRTERKAGAESELVDLKGGFGSGGKEAERVDGVARVSGRPDEEESRRRHRFC